MAGVDINWGAAGRAPYAGQRALEGYQLGKQERRQIDLERALGALGPGLDNPEALSSIYAMDPRLASGLEDAAFQRGERAREGEGRAALAAYLLAGSGEAGAMSTPMAAPQNGEVGDPASQGAPASILPAGSEAGAPAADPASARTDAFARVARSSPELAFKLREQESGAAIKQLEVAEKVNELGIQLLGTVYDQPSYTAAAQRYNQMLQQFGFPPAQLPETYSPEVIRQLQMQSLSVKEQIAAAKPISAAPGTIFFDPVTMKEVARNPLRPQYMKVLGPDGNETVIEVGGGDGGGAAAQAGAGQWGGDFDPIADVRQAYGVEPTSGLRSREHQAALKAQGLTPTEGGAHPRGDGVDFPTPRGLTQQQFAAALEARFPGARAAPSNGGSVHVTFPGWGGAPDVSNSRGRYPDRGQPRTVYKGGRRPQAKSRAGIVRVDTPDEARALPSGTRFVDPNGVVRVRP